MPDGLNIDPRQIVDADLFGAVKRRPEAHMIEWSTRPPFYIMVAGMPQAVLTRYQDQVPAYEDYQRFSSAKRKWPGTEKFYYYRGLPVINDNDPPAQIRLRRLMAPAFSARKLASMEDPIKEFVAKKLDQIAETRTEFDVVTDFGHPLAAYILLGLCLDLDESVWPIFHRIAGGMAAFGQLAPGAETPSEYLAAWDDGYAYCHQLIETRRRSPKDDVIGNIVAAGEQDGRISTEEMFGTMLVLFTAGIGGIQNTTSYLLWRLCRDRAQLELLQSDLSLTTAAVTESLRMDNNAWTALRWATRDFEYAGLQLFENMPVHFMCSAPNYDPTVFENPEKFDILRTPHDMLGFGHGYHHCIGSLLAKTAVRIAIQQIVERFPKLHLADPDFYPEIIGGPKERGLVSMPLRLK
jgi:cytochrome P450